MSKVVVHDTPLMLVIICAKYGKIPSRTVRAVEGTRQGVTYSSSFIAKSRLNVIGDIGHGQRSLCATHPPFVPNNAYIRTSKAVSE